MVRLIDRIGGEKRHHDRLHEEFESDPENDAGDRPPIQLAGRT
jgi:hypothetical protein